MGNSKTLMTNGNIAQKIIVFAMPLFLGNLFQQLYNTADSLIVGKFLGSNALAAVSSSGNLIFLMVGFINGLAMGAGVVIARYFGAQKYDKLTTAIHTSIALGLIAGIFLTIFGYLIAPILLIWMDTPEVVLPDSTIYFQIYFLGSLGSVMYNVFVGVLQSIGDSKNPLIYLVISSIINIVLDVVFIAYFHMGVGSAAFATIISQFVSAILCFIKLTLTKECYQVRVKDIKIDHDMMKLILNYGIYSGLQNSIIAFANVVVQTNINAFGELAMAGCGAFSKIEGFAFLPITSFTMALSTFVGQNLGANEYERAKKGANFGIVCTMILSEIIGAIVYFSAPLLISAFDSNPQVIYYGVLRAKIAAWFFALLAFSHCMAAILRGAGNTKIPMLIMLLCWCIIRVTFITLTVHYFPYIEVVCWAYPLTWTLSSICFFYYLYKGNWVYGFSDR